MIILDFLQIRHVNISENPWCSAVKYIRTFADKLGMKRGPGSNPIKDTGCDTSVSPSAPAC